MTEERQGPTLGVGYLNEVQLRLRFRKSLDLQNSSLLGNFKRTNAFQVYAICFHELFTKHGVYIKAFGELKIA